ncbi:MAG TPA: hypothetical protein VEB70_03265 [Noviherbaspirillum sp.]|nr:hypothetical protein [Noviherbaspirillum sp.]
MYRYIIIPIALLAASGAVFAQSAPQSESPREPNSLREAIQESSGTSGSRGSGASGTVPTTEGNKALNSTVRGSASDATTSDRETSRRWPGVGSTGGATGTGTSSGTTDDPPTSGGNQQGSSASGTSVEGSATGVASGSQSPSTERLSEPGGSR